MPSDAAAGGVQRAELGLTAAANTAAVTTASANTAAFGQRLLESSPASRWSEMLVAWRSVALRRAVGGAPTKVLNSLLKWD